MDTKLIQIKQRFEELEKQLTQGINDHRKLTELTKEHAKLQKQAQLIYKLEKYEKELEDLKILTKNEKDKNLLELYKDEEASLNQKITQIQKDIAKELQQTNENEHKNAIIEIRAGTGGEEAALFAREIFRMYTKYSEKQNWTISIASAHYTGTGGIKEIIATITGKGAYGKLQYESGIHRVQRIPATESSGRLHTSAVSVVILPEIDETTEIDIKDEEIKIDVYRATGPGGQSVNTTDSAVRITHLPTGIVVTCQDEKSQHKNKAKAMKILKSKLFQIEQEEKQKETAQKRKKAIKSGDRSEKIRTYNFPQRRVTDHRIKKNWFNLEDILDGDIDEILDEVKSKLNE